MSGTLVISLDFELYWGMPESFTAKTYAENILGAHQAVTNMLALFRERDVAATWATVGALSARSHAELVQFHEAAHARTPNRILQHAFDTRAADKSDPRFFAPKLIDAILSTPKQELATHSLFHTHVLADGEQAFAADIAGVSAWQSAWNTRTQSIVFPRNQHSPASLKACQAHGISVYRPNPTHWFYRPTAHETLPRRAARLLDTYMPVSGALTRKATTLEGMTAVPASIFLRPELGTRATLANRRIIRGLADAVARDEVVHLWWHPHNFGVHTRAHMQRLQTLLDFVDGFRARHGLQIRTMAEFRQA